MKTLMALFLFSTILCSCGISEKEYNKVVHERDSLLQVNEQLINGEERLMNYIILHSDTKEYIQAFENLKNLKKHHPESPLLKKHKDLFSTIESKATILIDSIDKAKNDSIKLANINELGVWQIGDIVNEFDEPTGKKFVCANFNGILKNSATAGSELRVYLQVADFYDEGGYKINLRYDEYNNGTFEREICQYAKIIDKKSRKVYRSNNEGAFYDEDHKGYDLKDILTHEGSYDFIMQFKYGTEYRFTINTEHLNNALVKVGLKSIDELI